MALLSTDLAEIYSALIQNLRSIKKNTGGIAYLHELNLMKQ